MSRSRPALEALESRCVPAGTPSLNSSFLGMTFTEGGSDNPPDTHVAAGPDFVVEVVNTALQYFDKATGQKLQQNRQSLEQLFGVQTTLSSILADPFVTYDELAGRFVVSAIELNTNPRQSRLHVAVSKTADPRDGFSVKQTVDLAEQNGSGSAFTADFPRLGWNADAYVWTFNMFNFVTNAFDHVQVLAADKATILNNGSAAFTFYRSDRPGGVDESDFTLVPATMHGSRPGDPLWLVGTTDAQSGNGGDAINVLKMTDVLSATPTLTTTSVPVTAYLPSVPALQPGSTTPFVSDLDNRVLSASYRDGTLVAAQNVGTSPTVTQAVWYQLDVADGSPALTASGVIDPGPTTFTLFPSIEIAVNGNLGMTYIQSSPTEFLSMYVTGKTPAEGTMEEPVLVFPRPGAGTVYNSQGRAGDFSGISPDPGNGTYPVNHSFWAANEFADATNNGRWGTAIANFAPDNLPPALPAPSLSGSDLVEGDPLTVNGVFTDPDPVAQAHTVVIDWGDGTARSVVPVAAGTFAYGPVAHVYTQESAAGRPYTLTVTVTDENGASAPPALLQVTVQDSPLTFTSFSPPHTTQRTKFTGAVATFTDAGGAEPLDNYSAEIDWGDGTQSEGTLSQAGEQFTVVGTHAYDREGSYDGFTVRVRSQGGSTAVSQGTAVVADAPLAATLKPLRVVEGQTSAPPVATFTDPGADPLQPDFSEYTVTVDWGDGSSPTAVDSATLTRTGSAFTIPATHQYLDEGSYTVTVSIQARGGSSALVTGTALVTDAGLTLTGRPLSAVSGQPFSGVVLTFQDNGPPEDPSNYTVLINWGDGTPTSPGTVVSTGDAFEVTAEHTFSREGAYAVSATVLDEGGKSSRTTSAATVADAPLTAFGADFATVAGGTFSGLVATFLDADPGGAARDFTATIDWGDGSEPTAGKVAESDTPGQFTVTGSHRYTAEGQFPVTVAIADAGGSTATAHSGAAARFVNYIVTGADAGAGPNVQVLDARTGALVFSFYAYDPDFTGGVRVAAGDVNADGIPDIITGPGPGGGPQVRVFDGATGQRLAGPLGSFFAYDQAFAAGVFVASGDVNGDGFADVLVGADAGGGPNVLAVSGRDGKALYNFFPYAREFTGGVRLAAGDVDGDGKDDLVCGPGAGGGPNVSVISGADGRTLLRSFFVYDAAFAAGIYVGAGDVNADGRADVIVGAGPGGGPDVKVISGADLAVLDGFFAYPADFTGGVRVGALALPGVSQARLLTAGGPGGAVPARVYDAATAAVVDDLFAYGPLYQGGIFIGGR